MDSTARVPHVSFVWAKMTVGGRTPLLCSTRWTSSGCAKASTVYYGWIVTEARGSALVTRWNPDNGADRSDPLTAPLFSLHENGYQQRAAPALWVTIDTLDSCVRRIAEDAHTNTPIPLNNPAIAIANLGDSRTRGGIGFVLRGPVVVCESPTCGAHSSAHAQTRKTHTNTLGSKFLLPPETKQQEAGSPHKKGSCALHRAPVGLGPSAFGQQTMMPPWCFG